MKISESDIDQLMDQIGEDSNWVDNVFVEFREDQAFYSSYIFSSNFNILTGHEREALLFLSLFIFKICKNFGLTSPLLSEKSYFTKEDENWDTLESQKAKVFRHKLDAFYDGYKETDMLALIEDTLTDDDEEEITKVGRELIFISTKSFLDCLINGKAK